MKPVVIIRHVENEGPGYLADVLDHNAIPRQLVRIDRHERLPDDVTGLGGLVFMGGPMSVNDTLPWVPHALALQCHIEMTADMVRDWLRAAGDTLPPPSASVQHPSAMLAGLDENVRRMQAVADRLYARWLRGLN